MIATLVAFGNRAMLPRLAVLLAWGSVVGSALQFAVQVPVVVRVAPDLRFALEIAELLLTRRAKLLVVACNAASAAALDALRERMLSTTLGVHVTGVIDPESRLAAGASTNRRKAIRGWGRSSAAVCRMQSS